MSRAPRAGGTYVTPITAAGVEATAAPGRGNYTLVLGTTYVFMLGGPDATVISAHFQWDASIVITSLTVEDCNMPETEASDYSTTAGDWIDEDPSTAFVGVVGAGVSHTAGVATATGGALGGCMFHIADTGARRTRIKVVVGATGGVLRCAAHAKE